MRLYRGLTSSGQRAQVQHVVAGLLKERRPGTPPVILRTRKPPTQTKSAHRQQSLAEVNRRALRLDNLSTALDQVKMNSNAKFDETVDVAIHLNTDVRRTDHRVRGVVTLPHGIGKSIAVAVFTKDGRQAEAARSAGADMVGAEDIVEAIKAGRIDFERALATPDAMPLLAQVARSLGPKGLMPSPKRGTVVAEIGPAVAEAKAGQYEFKANREGVVLGPVGKVSFDKVKLVENLDVFITAVLQKRPEGFRSKPPKGIVISSTMGKGVRLDRTLF